MTETTTLIALGGGAFLAGSLGFSLCAAFTWWRVLSSLQNTVQRDPRRALGICFQVAARWYPFCRVSVVGAGDIILRTDEIAGHLLTETEVSNDECH